ncbi:MAG TPA: hypothetical protein VES67_11655 [Vicinamibacterales bacterium]|nr:hypothetical protein [Vicinamibacterales bacterium]
MTQVSAECLGIQSGDVTPKCDVSGELDPVARVFGTGGIGQGLFQDGERKSLFARQFVGLHGEQYNADLGRL